MSVSSGTRIRGLDLARGLAILGMFVAHILVPEEPVGASPDTWISLVNGRSAALFAVLAGVSLALLSGRRTPATGVDLLRARLRIGTRAVLIFALGGILALGPHYIAVILEYYAVAFILAIMFLSWRPRNLFLLAGGIALFGPPLQVGLALAIREWAGPGSAFTELMFTGYYPVILWLAFMLLGLGIGRLDLGSATIRARLALFGAAGTVLGYGGAALLGSLVRVETPQYVLGMPDWANLLGATPHSGSTFELIGAGGVALLVIAACLSLPAPAHSILFPVEATGKMALTAYSVHLIALAIINASGYYGVDTAAQLFWFIAVTLVICPLWILLLKRGPLEALLTRASRAAASAPAPAVAPH